jgi:radical SAM superfamily enzyme YgiQ (UPF0313 family)
MKTLLINPKMPYSFWTLESSCQFSGAKALAPPLGLLTVAALLPDAWEFRLADLNTRTLSAADWQWAELVLLSGMLIQKTALLELVQQAKKRGKTVVVGGPYPTTLPQEVLAAGADLVVQGEAESIMPALIQALADGKTGLALKPKKRPEMGLSPIPRYDLINFADYVIMNVQTSRGCPYGCEFCDVIKLFGRRPRYKAPAQVLAELERLFNLGWRGPVVISDDNFIGNKKHARAILDSLIPWMQLHGEPFYFWTQTSVNLGQDLELINLLTAANFNTVFIGVESTEAEVLAQTGKHHNKADELKTWLNTISANGLNIVASFIIGFDGEKPGVDVRIRQIAEDCDLPQAMVGILEALPGTDLWERLRREGRLKEVVPNLDPSGCSMNFIPQRPEADILAEWQRAITHLYKPENYLARTYRYILNMRPTRSFQAGQQTRPGVGSRKGLDHQALWRELRGAAILFWRQGLKAPYRRQFWRQLWDIQRRNPSRLIKYLVLCSLGENSFALRERVQRGFSCSVSSLLRSVDS